MILKLVREGLGRTIALVSYLTQPKPQQRTEMAQKQVDEQAKNLALYQFFACPFCIRIRRNIHRLNLPIEIRDAQNNPEHREALLKQGGKIQVPCLRIEENGKTRWLYESTDILLYLEKQFS